MMCRPVLAGTMLLAAMLATGPAAAAGVRVPVTDLAAGIPGGVQTRLWCSGVIAWAGEWAGMYGEADFAAVAAGRAQRLLREAVALADAEGVDAGRREALLAFYADVIGRLRAEGFDNHRAVFDACDAAYP